MKNIVLRPRDSVVVTLHIYYVDERGLCVWICVHIYRSNNAEFDDNVGNGEDIPVTK